MRLSFSRYSVRTMLVAVAIVALGIAWWIRPRSIELHRDDGTLAARLRLKRDWRGEMVGCGRQSWFLSDGQCFRQQDVEGAVWRDGDFVGPGQYGDPVYPPHFPPDPPTADYVGWLVRDRIPISTDLPRSEGERFSYP
jgi:hypothetical protein